MVYLFRICRFLSIQFMTLVTNNYMWFFFIPYDRKPGICSLFICSIFIYSISMQWVYMMCQLMDIERCSIWHQGAIKYLCFFLYSLHWYWNEYTTFIIYSPCLRWVHTKILSCLIIFTHLYSPERDTDLGMLCSMCKIQSFARWFFSILFWL